MTHSIEKEFRHDFPPDDPYYSLDRLLSHEADISWCQSIRDVGKSYNMRMKCHKAISNGFSCVWLRWQRTELGTAMQAWQKQFGDAYVDVTPKGTNIVYKIWMNLESNTYIVFGAVKDSVHIKDVQIANLRWLVYDECVPEQYDVRTRRDVEFDKFTSIYMSFARESKQMRAVLMCNVIDWFNPFTQAWNIRPFDAGIIKVFIDVMTIETDTGPKTARLKIAFENIKPSRAMLDRVIELAKLRYSNTKDLQKYINNATAKDYGMVAKCPDMSIPLEPLQFRRGERYYGFRICNGVYYFTETSFRNLPTEVFKFGTNGNREGRNPQLGKAIEELINQGRCKFDSGHTYNEFMNGLADYRMRNGI